MEVFDSQGNQLVHQGHLARETRNYADRTWFQRANATGVWISDLELGYRQVAARQHCRGAGKRVRRF